MVKVNSVPKCIGSPTPRQSLSQFPCGMKRLRVELLSSGRDVSYDDVTHLHSRVERGIV